MARVPKLRFGIELELPLLRGDAQSWFQLAEDLRYAFEAKGILSKVHPRFLEGEIVVDRTVWQIDRDASLFRAGHIYDFEIQSPIMSFTDESWKSDLKTVWDVLEPKLAKDSPDFWRMCSTHIHFSIVKDDDADFHNRAGDESVEWSQLDSTQTGESQLGSTQTGEYEYSSDDSAEDLFPVLEAKRIVFAGMYFMAAIDDMMPAPANDTYRPGGWKEYLKFARSNWVVLDRNGKVAETDMGRIWERIAQQTTIQHLYQTVCPDYGTNYGTRYWKWNLKGLQHKTIKYRQPPPCLEAQDAVDWITFTLTFVQAACQLDLEDLDHASSIFTADSNTFAELFCVEQLPQSVDDLRSFLGQITQDLSFLDRLYRRRDMINEWLVMPSNNDSFSASGDEDDEDLHSRAERGEYHGSDDGSEDPDHERLFGEDTDPLDYAHHFKRD
ncbi:hypothetical protein F4778DRAFT_668231 [Xylariomycetidae sp. FL2044]|nr:hypothetical protein F4778DRAFT_668231 [Xylariomycetidae sp. FL2044]